MKLELKSCKSDAQSMTVVVVDADSKQEATAFITARTCGGPFLAHDASVAQLVSELLASINEKMFWPGDEPAPEVVEETKPSRTSKASKGAA